MTKFFRYITWNVLLIGTLVLSHIFNFSVMITLLGIFFGFEAIAYFLILLSPKEKYPPSLKSELAWWKIPFEIFYIILAFYMGYPKIAICMFVTFCAYLYLCIDNSKNKKDI